MDVNYWELSWLHSVAQKPLGSVLPPAVVLLWAHAGRQGKSEKCLCRKISMSVCKLIYRSRYVC